MQTDFLKFANEMHYVANTGLFKVFLLCICIFGILSVITIDEE
jgi:hypothetical protein